MMGELEMKKEFVAAPPQYPQSAILRQPDYKTLIQKQQTNILAKLQRRKIRLQAAINASTSDSDCADLEDDMFDIDNEIIQVKYDMSVAVKVHSPKMRRESGRQRKSIR